MLDKTAQYSHRKEIWTIGDLETNGDRIDCNPVHQRLERSGVVYDELSKSQGIIRAILRRIDVGQITIHTTPNGEFEYESIDGGHRKRAILAFLNNEFPNPKDGKFFREYSDKQRQEFRDIELTFCIYENLTGPQVGEIFRTLNNITPVNHQEKLNSYGNIPIANAVRETVRVIPSVGNTPNTLFQAVIKNSKKTFSYIRFNNEGLKQDEWMARLFYRYYVDGKIGEAKEEQLQEMYDANPSQEVVDDLQKKINGMLKFLLSMANQRIQIYGTTKLMDITEANLFARLYLHMANTFGSYSIKDEETFFKTVMTAHFDLSDKNTTDPELLAQSTLDKAKLVWSQYKSSLNEYKKQEAIEFPINLLLKRVDLASLVTVKDKKRGFTINERERALTKQGFKSTVTGKALKMKDAAAGHVIAHADGGKTIPSNLEMVESSLNTAMGQLPPSVMKKHLASKHKNG